MEGIFKRGNLITVSTNHILLWRTVFIFRSRNGDFLWLKTQLLEIPLYLLALITQNLQILTSTILSKGFVISNFSRFSGISFLSLQFPWVPTINSNLSNSCFDQFLCHFISSDMKLSVLVLGSLCWISPFAVLQFFVA